MKQIAGIYTFREITDEAGLLEAFQMRYQTYANNPGLRNLIEENTVQAEIDAYDPFARHYGLFKSDAAGNPRKMIGYIRVIWHSLPPIRKPQIQNITGKLNIDLPEKPHPFYIQKNFPSPIHTSKIPFNDPFISICEPGRFILLPSFRSAGLAQFAIECTMSVICELSSVALGIIDCRRTHSSMYRRNGFTWLAEQDQPDIPSNPLNLLMISAAGVAKQLPDLPERIRRYREKGYFQTRLGHIDWVAAAYLPTILRRLRRKTKTRVLGLGQSIGKVLPQSLRPDLAHKKVRS